VLAVNAENVVEERKVRLGVEDSARVEVLSGLSEGERVIIGNRSEYHNGQKIQPKERDGRRARKQEVRADVWIFDTQPICYHRGVPGRGDRGHGDAARMPVDLFPPINIPVWSWRLSIPECHHSRSKRISPIR